MRLLLALAALMALSEAQTAPVWLTLDEVAERLHQSRQTLYIWRVRKFGPKGIKVGNRVLYRRTEVERWEREQERLQGQVGAA
jgi:predicted DNA-binding transcriptional regulator AlpA